MKNQSTKRKMSLLSTKYYGLRTNTGQAMMVSVIFFVVLGLSLALSIGTPALRLSRIAREHLQSTASFLTAESLEEDVSYRIRTGKQYSATETIVLNGATATTTVVNNAVTGRIELTTTGQTSRAVRKKYMELVHGDTISFNYGAQAGRGGIIMRNTSSILGNVYSNGGATGTNNNLIRGSVVSASSSGLIEGLHATGTARANTIKNSTVDEDAYYKTLTNTTVGGTLYPNSEDRPYANFPITDETLDEWEEVAEEGGIHTSPCPYTIRNTTTIGPIKINCDLTIKTNDTITIAGMVWVVGNISFETGPTIALDPDLGAYSIAMIADNPSNRSTASTITIRNTTEFQGSGTPGSVIMLVSRNTSIEDGGSTKAIELQQSGTGDIMLYSNHGKIEISQSSLLKEVTGYLIELKNSAELIYDSGLASTLFDTGPGGSYDIWDWKESQ